MSVGLALALGLLLLLERVHALQRFGRVDVGDRAGRRVRERLRVLLPALRRDTEALAEDGEEDLRLVLAEARERAEAGVQLARVGCGRSRSPPCRRRSSRRCGLRARGRAWPSSRGSGGARACPGTPARGRRGSWPRSSRRRACRRGGRATSRGRGTPTPSVPAGRGACRAGARTNRIRAARRRRRRR